MVYGSKSSRRGFSGTGVMSVTSLPDEQVWQLPDSDINNREGRDIVDGGGMKECEEEACKRKKEVESICSQWLCHRFCL